MTERGIGAITLILALLIAALLYAGYLRLHRAGESTAPDSPATAVDHTKAFACATNRRTVERELGMWAVNHPDEAATLEAVGSAARCPTGGTYRLDGRRVLCSQHE